MPYQEYHEPPRVARPFVVAPYHPQAKGRLEPTTPSSGPCFEQDQQSCRISWHSWRKRKAGPEFELAVMQCKTHHRYFTVYPHGYAPYQRQPLAPISPSGGPVLGLESATAFEGTVFTAALDAAQGKAWQRSSQERNRPYWGTQLRQLQRALLLSGVSQALSENMQHQIATILGVASLLLHEWSQKLGQAGYRLRGQAVKVVLEQMRPSTQSARRLAEAGCILGLWGTPIDRRCCLPHNRRSLNHMPRTRNQLRRSGQPPRPAGSGSHLKPEAQLDIRI
jgi:hypothetical protein